MKGRNHAALGMTAGASAGIALYGAGFLPCFFGCCMGELFPDLDLPTSSAGKVFHPISVVFNKLFGHRGFLHSPMFGLIIAGISYFFIHETIAQRFFVGFSIGYFLHLFQDSFTKGGIRWFFPAKKRITLFPIKSGNPLEYIITGITSACFVGFTVWQHFT